MTDTERWPCLSEAAFRGDPLESDAARARFEATADGVSQGVTSLNGTAGPWPGLESARYDGVSQAVGVAAVRATELVTAAEAVSEAFMAHFEQCEELLARSDAAATAAASLYEQVLAQRGQLDTLAQHQDDLNDAFLELGDSPGFDDDYDAIVEQLESVTDTGMQIKNGLVQVEIELDKVQLEWLSIRADEDAANYATALVLDDVPLPAATEVVEPGPNDPPLQLLNVPSTTTQVAIYESVDFMTGQPIIVVEGHDFGYSYNVGEPIHLGVNGGMLAVDIDPAVKSAITFDVGDDNLLLDVNGGSADVTVNGSDASSAITASTSGSLNVDGGGGNDQITVGGSGNHTIDGGAGDDTVTVVSGSSVNVAGGDGNDTINVGDHSEILTSLDDQGGITVVDPAPQPLANTAPGPSGNATPQPLANTAPQN